MLTEEDFKTVDVYISDRGAKYYRLGDKDRETWKKYILAFQTAAQSFGSLYLTELEEAYRAFMKNAQSVTLLVKNFNQVKKGLTYPELCNEIENIPELHVYLLYSCEVLLSDTSRINPDARPNENLLYSTFSKLNGVLGEILQAYEGNRTTTQKVKNLVGGLKSKYEWLQTKMMDLYKYRLETVLRVYAGVKCVPQTPGDLDMKNALIFYDQELEDKFAEAKEDLEDYEAHKQGRFRPSMPRMNLVSMGYVPRRGRLMRTQDREHYFFQPTNEGNTGGEASDENITAFFEERDARREANNERAGVRSRSALNQVTPIPTRTLTRSLALTPPGVLQPTPPVSTRPPPKPLPSTLRRTLTATPAEISEIARRLPLSSIQEENQSNQEGGRRHKKTRKGRTSKKRTRKH